jgi:hypothetical protein
MQAFLDKGRLSPLLESIPVRVILDDTCALLGAAAYAEARAAEVLANHVHTHALVENLLQFIGKRDVLDDELAQLKAEAGEGGLEFGGDL